MRYCFCFFFLIAVILASCKKDNKTESQTYSDTLYHEIYIRGGVHTHNSGLVTFTLKPLGDKTTIPYDSFEIVSSLASFVSPLTEYTLYFVQSDTNDSNYFYYYGGFITPDSYFNIETFNNFDSISLQACLGCTLGYADSYSFSGRRK